MPMPPEIVKEYGYVAQEPQKPPPKKPGDPDEPPVEPKKEEEPEDELVAHKLSGVSAAELKQFMLDQDLFF